MPERINEIAFEYMLDELAENDGACLYWQLANPPVAILAQELGRIRIVNDVAIHPDAIENEPGMSYSMPVNTDPLCEVYRQWNESQGLNLGSADEHWFDETLTQEQRDWLRAFSARWESIARLERY